MAFGRLQGFVEQGGHSALAALSGSAVVVQQSYPGTLVTVRDSGTITLSTLYSDSAGTPLSNPFNADTHGYWYFHAANGQYDVQFTGPVAYTLPALTLGSTSSVLRYDIRDFGAKVDGVTDDTLAVQATVDVAGPHHVYFPAGTCLITNTITINQERIKIVGEGQQISRIKFQPLSSPKVCFDFNRGSLSLNQMGITGFGFTSTNTTFQKIMIRLIDVRGIEISDIASAQTEWTGANSIGIQVKGRELINIHDCLIAADTPINIGLNPNFAGLDCDHGHFWNLTLIAGLATSYNIEVDPTATLTSFNIDGYQAWNLGLGGIRYNSSGALSSLNIHISNVRHEQPAAATGYIVNIGGTANIQNMRMENIFGGLGMRGIRLRTVNNLSIQNYFYFGSSVAVDIDGSVTDFALLNTYLGTTPASVSIVNQVPVLATALPADNTSPGRVSTWYKTSANQSPDILLNGARFWATSGTLANGVLFAILNNSQNSQGSYLILVSAKNNLTNAAVGGTVIVSGGAAGVAALAGGTANFNVGNIVGSLTILWSSESNVFLFNQLAGGATIDYTVSVFYN
jgi:hypothetical protein